MSAAIRLDNVTKTYPLFASLGERLRATFWGKSKGAAPAVHLAVNGISLTIGGGETVGILGVNGAGKSTLLQLITGVLTPTSGTVAVNGRIAALLELGAGFNPALTGRQNAEFQCRLNGIPADQITTVMADIEAFADIGYFFDQPMRTYSSGMYVRVAFAAAISVDPDILIVDEALAVGDARFQNKCYRRLEDFQKAGKTIIVVTHSTDVVTRFCTRAIVLDAGQLVLDGTAKEAVGEYLTRLYGRKTEETPTPFSEERTPPGEERSWAENAPADEALPAFTTHFTGDGIDDRLHSRPHYNPQEERFGDKRVVIVDAVLLSGGGQAPTHIEGVLDVELAIQVRAVEHVARPSVGFILKNVQNTYVFGTTTELRGDPIKPLEPGDIISAAIRIHAQVLPGDYFLDLGVADVAGGGLIVCDWRASAMHLTVGGKMDFFGLADLGGSFIHSHRHAHP